MQDVMTDPAVASDGTVHERQDIHGWINMSNSSTWTNQALKT